ncbi:MAG: hypothetical protein J0H40_12355 [Rhizobiales bacterium]|nr:hypothetical protein [Hyphomicrobiales bacterium]
MRVSRLTKCVIALLLARDALRPPWMWSLALVLVALFGARSDGAGDNEKAPEAEPYASPTSG